MQNKTKTASFSKPIARWSEPMKLLSETHIPLDKKPLEVAEFPGTFRSIPEKCRVFRQAFHHRIPAQHRIHSLTRAANTDQIKKPYLPYNHTTYHVIRNRIFLTWGNKHKKLRGDKNLHTSLLCVLQTRFQWILLTYTAKYCIEYICLNSEGTKRFNFHSQTD